MSRNSRLLNCTPDDVFDVLFDGWSFAIWVVGAARIRDVDDNWPEPGSRIHHSVGFYPLLINDITKVESVQRPRQLVLTARAWPAGEATVTITCEAVGAQTRVTIEETSSAGPAVLIIRPVQDVLLGLRNVEALKRLAYLAEGRAAASRATPGS